jgi:hypothetical protein
MKKRKNYFRLETNQQGICKSKNTEFAFDTTQFLLKHKLIKRYYENTFNFEYLNPCMEFLQYAVSCNALVAVYKDYTVTYKDGKAMRGDFRIRKDIIGWLLHPELVDLPNV